MTPKENQPAARPVFRWLAGLTCPVFVALGISSWTGSGVSRRLSKCEFQVLQLETERMQAPMD